MTRVLAIPLLTFALFTISTSVSATAISAISASANGDFIRIARTEMNGEPEEEEDDKVELKWLTKNSIEVKYKKNEDVVTDVVKLTTTGMFPENVHTPTEEDCLFEGKLPSDPDSMVEVEGCMGEEDTTVTIASDIAIEDGVQDFTIHPKSSPGKTFHISPVNGFGKEAVEADEKSEVEAKFESPAKFFTSQYNGGLPRSVELKTNIKVDKKLVDKHGGSRGVINFMNRVLTRTNIYLLRANVQMKLKIIGYNEVNEGTNFKADKPSILRVALKRSQNSESYFAYDLLAPGKPDTVGLAFLGTFCSTRGSSVNINEHYTDRNPTISTARTYAHELGHNVGMSHDFDNKHGGVRGKCDGKGLMSYGRAPDAWSDCSNNDFRAWYQRQGYYCARTSRMEMEFDAWGNFAADDNTPHTVKMTGSCNFTDITLTDATKCTVSGAGGLGKSAAAVCIAVLVAINSAL